MTKNKYCDMLIKAEKEKRDIQTGKERQTMFFRVMKDMVDEYRGVDVEARYRIEREFKKKELSEYKEKNAISKSNKKYLTFISAAFLIYGLFMLIGEIGGARYGRGLLTILQMLLCLAAIILVRVDNKDLQKLGGILFLLFVAIQLARSFIIFI